MTGNNLALHLLAAVALALPSRAAEPAPQGARPADEAGYDSFSVLAEAIQLIRQDYIDEDKIDYRGLAYDALRGMLAALDPHSQFLAPDDFEEMQDDSRSRFGGLGIQVTLRAGILTVVSPMEDTPGAKAGILPGDQILEIDGKTTERMSLGDAIKLLRGEPGQKVALRLYRSATKEFLALEIARAIIQVPSVQDARILPADLAGTHKIGYARITQFNEPTAEELKTRLDELAKQGMQALVLDLRNNPGGLLNSAVDVCAEFLPPGELVVSTEGRRPSQKKTYRTSRGYTPRPWFPMAVLINGGSASGSEIVAGALKDLRRAIAVGETTFGKGSVQSVISLSDGAAIRLTTAKYFTPGKQVIHGHGITPNIRATMSPEQERALILHRNADTLPPEERAELPPLDDTQLSRAIDALKGVLLFRDRATPREPAAAPPTPSVPKP